jgi:hypothetical protein
MGSVETGDPIVRKTSLILGAVSAALSLGFVAAASAAPVQWTVASGGNDHWYEFIAADVQGQAFIWDEAFAASAASSFMGMQGYLATVTSQAEDRFVSATVADNQVAWLSGSDNGNEGVWSWRAGPEAGQIFWNNGVTLIYANWGSGEPNNCCGGESFLQTNFSGGWNDHGGPGNAGQRNGYVVEYSQPRVQIPEPMTLALVLPALLAAGGLARKRR